MMRLLVHPLLVQNLVLLVMLAQIFRLGLRAIMFPYDLRLETGLILDEEIDPVYETIVLLLVLLQRLLYKLLAVLVVGHLVAVAAGLSTIGDAVVQVLVLPALLTVRDVVARIRVLVAPIPAVTLYRVTHRIFECVNAMVLELTNGAA